MKILSDEELMASYIQGEASAFEELFERYRGKIFAFLTRRLGQSRQAIVEDVFQLTWLKIHQSRQDFNLEKKFSTWIYAIAQNGAFDHLKKASTRYEVEEDQDSPAASNAELDSPEELVIKKEVIENLDWALIQLPENMKEAIILCDIEELSSKDAAKVLGRSDNSIRQSLFRGRQKLKEILTEGYEGKG